jgi:hypothetical protein
MFSKWLLEKQVLKRWPRSEYIQLEEFYDVGDEPSCCILIIENLFIDFTKLRFIWSAQEHPVPYS